MSLNAVSKHIKVLERAGLVSRETEWREHLIDVNLEPLLEVRRWFRELRSIWEMRLESLDHILTEETTPDEDVTVPSATVDPVEGGPFEIIMKVREKELPHSGVYETIDRPRRLVFTWESPHSIDGSTVTQESSYRPRAPGFDYVSRLGHLPGPFPAPAFVWFRTSPADPPGASAPDISACHFILSGYVPSS